MEIWERMCDPLRSGTSDPIQEFSTEVAYGINNMHRI